MSVPDPWKRVTEAELITSESDGMVALVRTQNRSAPLNPGGTVLRYHRSTRGGPPMYGGSPAVQGPAIVVACERAYVGDQGSQYWPPVQTTPPGRVSKNQTFCARMFPVLLNEISYMIESPPQHSGRLTCLWIDSPGAAPGVV
jgi:hypothetical protein